MCCEMKDWTWAQIGALPLPAAWQCWAHSRSQLHPACSHHVCFLLSCLSIKTQQLCSRLCMHLCFYRATLGLSLTLTVTIALREKCHSLCLVSPVSWEQKPCLLMCHPHQELLVFKVAVAALFPNFVIRCVSSKHEHCSKHVFDLPLFPDVLTTCSLINIRLSHLK